MVDGELLGDELLGDRLSACEPLDGKLLGDGLLDGKLVDCRPADDSLVAETSGEALDGSSFKIWFSGDCGVGWTDEDGPLDWLVDASFPVDSVATSPLAADTSVVLCTSALSDTVWAMIKGKKIRIIRNENRILENLSKKHTVWHDEIRAPQSTSTFGWKNFKGEACVVV